MKVKTESDVQDETYDDEPKAYRAVLVEPRDRRVAGDNYFDGVRDGVMPDDGDGVGVVEYVPVVAVGDDQGDTNASHDND